MSVDLVNAQMAEAWQVQQKRWKPQLRQESRDGQLFEVLRNQNMLRILSENEKCLSYSLEVNQFTDSTQEEYESTYLRIQTPKREQVGHIGTIPLRWWHSGSSM